MCFFLTLLFLGPRAVLFLWWIIYPAMWNAVFDTFLFPLLGIVFVPWTTLMFVLVGQGGIVGFEWVWMALAVAADVFSYTGGAVGGRGRVGSYY
ncbi:MAG TPA: hypothetical protein VF114_09850 [Candidatus Limnocylindria bacterium]